MSAQKANDGDARVSAVVVVGSLHYDIMVDAPDRPRKGETVAGLSWSPKFGGKGGNQALAAEGQGVPTAMVGAVGGDDFGAALLAGLDRGGVDRSAVATLSGVGSGMSVAIFDAEGDYGAVIVSGSNLSVKPSQAHDELLRSAKVLILQNEIPEGINGDVARRARVSRPRWLARWAATISAPRCSPGSIAEASIAPQSQPCRVWVQA